VFAWAVPVLFVGIRGEAPRAALLVDGNGRAVVTAPINVPRATPRLLSRR
jgi:hypothetical protein